MNYNTIHETFMKDIISDIIDVGKSAKNFTADKPKSKSNGINVVGKKSSLATASSALTAVFPVICSTSISPSSAMMATKAIERKCVSMLQMVFSAAQFTNNTSAMEYISHFHSNLNSGKVTFDDVESLLGELDESVRINATLANMVFEDCKCNTNYYFEDDINESSLNGYKILNKSGRTIITEKIRPSKPDNRSPEEIEWDAEQWERDEYQWNHNVNKFAMDDKRWKREDEEYDRDVQRYNMAVAKYRDDVERLDMERDKARLEKDKVEISKIRNKLEKRKLKSTDKMNKFRMDDDLYKRETNRIQNRLVSDDVKKANEMNPTLMMINFYNTDFKKESQAVIGVKAKLYPVQSTDVIDKIITKNQDNNVLLNLVRASTREISFAKDFLFAIDKAKLDAVSNSKKPSAGLFRALERRSLSGKIRKAMKSNDITKCIATMVISQEEVEEMQKYNHIDVTNTKVIIPIMEKLNLMFFMIIDQSSETVSLLQDGEVNYETYTFDALERESSDANYRKIINLITKMAR